MRKIKVAIIIGICVVIILIGTIFGIKLNYLNKIKKISNSIVFKTANNYETIDSVVFYSEDLKLDEELKENFIIIANELKEKYPGKSILYLSDLEDDSFLESKEGYRCIQIFNGQKIKNTNMNVLINEDGNVEVQFLNGNDWEQFEKRKSYCKKF